MMWLPRSLGLILVCMPSVLDAEDVPKTTPPTGLERRIPWNDSRVVGSPDPLPPYKVIRAFPKLEVFQPLTMLPEPGTDRLFILQHMRGWNGPGRLLAAQDDQDASETVQLLEVDGLAVGFAFHPNYEQNGYLYLGMNGLGEGGKKQTQAVRYTVDREAPYGIDPESRLVIIGWDSDGHDGGDLAFGNDGYLYVSAGDGSSDSDANVTGQRIDDIPGSVIRIDVDHPDPGKNYSVPPDNPFVDRPNTRPELWAYGLRNPWRLSYDRESGQLWVGNNGQDLWEQVYLIEKGGNYGWSVTEGASIFQAQRKAGPDPISPPAADHHHSEARSLTGGRVYRGKRLPELVGAYLYGDWSTGRVWGIRHDGKEVTWNEELVDTPFNITGFGEDHEGEIYVIDQGSGFYRLEPTTAADQPTQPFPTLLSETGLFADVAALEPHVAALPYDVVAPQWADGAAIERFAAFPGLEKIEQKPQLNAGGSWSLPNGTVLVQTLSLDVLDESGEPAHKRIETRLMVRQQGEWTGYSYRWNDEQTDAELLPSEGGADFLEVPDPAEPGGVREQVWRYPSRTECLVCHSRATGFVQGFTPIQLDRERDFGGVVADQLRTFEHIGLFEGSLPTRAADRTRLVNPYDDLAPLDARVRSYLSVNCSVCHVEAGGGNSKISLALGMANERMLLIDEVPVHTQFNIPDARLVAPGAPERSVLHHRISLRESGQMPPLGTNEVDREAVEMIAEWIRGLPKK